MDDVPFISFPVCVEKPTDEAVLPRPVPLVSDVLAFGPVQNSNNLLNTSGTRHFMEEVDEFSKGP